MQEINTEEAGNNAEIELTKIINKYNLNKECENEIRTLILACVAVTVVTTTQGVLKKAKIKTINICLTVAMTVVVLALLVITGLRLI